MFSPQSGRERGNIMVYILIAIALFGGLTLVLSRQNKQSESQSVSDEQLALQVKDVLTYAATVGNVVEQMETAGSEYNDLVFNLPDSGSYATNAIHNIYHPSGGGLNPMPADPKVFTGAANNPLAGWYIGRFNNVEGTPSSAQDIIVAAHQISQRLCAALNKKLTGNAAIPTLGANPAYYLIPSGTAHNLGNGELTKASCTACYDRTALCVSNTGGTAWTFYSIAGVQ